MNERVEYVGEWWVPGEKSTPWSGRLVFDPLVGITLDVSGSRPGLIYPVDPSSQSPWPMSSRRATPRRTRRRRLPSA